VSPNPAAAGRIAARFAELAHQGRAAFVAYVMAGDPDAETAFRILEGLPGAGADLIELGMPFSDPMADGPPIQRAALRALASGMTLEGVFDMARRFRLADAITPIVLMGYLNPIVTLGFEAFAGRAAEAGIDGLIAVDCPPEEAEPLADALDRAGIDLIRLATPTTDDARLAIVARRTRGFVYYVSVAGVTGAKSAVADDVAPAVARVRAASGLPVAVGFGIRTPEQAAAIARVADAAVVGSALVDAIAASVADGGDPAARLLATATALGEAISSARVMADEAR
jgi:tryptophan synthase alpha chain